MFYKPPRRGRSCFGRPTRTYQHQLCMVTGCSLEDLLKPMDDSDEWRERERDRERQRESVKEIRSDNAT